MPATNAILTRLILTVSTGLLLLSSGVRKTPPPSPQARLAQSERLGRLLENPRRITPADIAFARAAWGPEAALRLEALRASAR